MSRTILKKELSSLSKEQLVEVILAAYRANKESKEYFDFFINPRPRELLERFEELVAKEFSRTKRGHRSKARISHIKKLLRRFSSFEPGTDFVLEFYFFTVNHALLAERQVYFTPVLFKGVKAIAVEALGVANKAGEFDRALDAYRSLVDQQVGTGYFNSLIAEALREFMDNPKNFFPRG